MAKSIKIQLMLKFNYKLQRQNLKAFRKTLTQVDSRVSQGSEFQVTYATYKSISEWLTFMWTLGCAKFLNYKLQRQHLKAFRKTLTHVDSRVSQGSEFQVTYATFKSISEWFTFMWTLGCAKCLNC